MPFTAIYTSAYVILAIKLIYVNLAVVTNFTELSTSSQDLNLVFPPSIILIAYGFSLNLLSLAKFKLFF